jgi:hypothetical protein
MGEPLESLYFDWLYAKVMLSNTPAELYSDLLQTLYDTEFIWLILGDDNRVEDGLMLRREFCQNTGISISDFGFMSGCSVLEMMIAFSRRAEFQTDINANEWFWEFVSELNLSQYYNERFNKMQVDNILSNFVWRTYSYNGEGGMFPLNGAQTDQRDIEIWYQFCAYLVEKHFF